MKAWFLTLVDVTSSTLYKPEELPAILRGGAVGTPHWLIAAILPSASIATGAYLLRDYYESVFLFSILFHTLLQAVLFLVIAFITGAIVDAMMHAKRPEKAGRSRDVFRIAIFSLLPLAFVFPAAVIARITPIPKVVALVFGILLYLWVIFNLVKSIQFLYEMPLRDVVRSIAMSLGAILGLPVLVFGLLLVKIVSNV
ncbi:MAG: hypothetical protein K8S54_09505 [Spirochaetia bacterium]|nr:hypothetical protein [Spirochaetia bacterium]